MKMKLSFAALSCVLIASDAIASSVVTESADPRVPSVIPGEIRTATQAVMESRKSDTFESFSGNAVVSHRFAMSAAEPNAFLRKAEPAPVQGNRRAPFQVGIGRDVPAEQQRIEFSGLQWETLSDGSKTARIALEVADAAAFRVGVNVIGPADGVVLRFASGDDAKAYRGAPLVTGKRHWSPTIDGSRGVAEIALAANRSPADYSLSIDKISQMANSTVSLNERNGEQKARAPSTCSASPLSIGCSDSCNIDLACVSNPSQALTDISRATTKIVFVDDDDGKSYLCSGTLLNSNASPRRPYIFSAAHCIDSQREAASAETFWFFDSVACNALNTPAFQRITTGTSLRFADENMDVSLLELNDAPPNGAVFASWDATIIPTNLAQGRTVLVGVHHPSGDLKAFSEGRIQGYVRGSLSTDSYIEVRWTPGKGTTEGGSSGSGIFTYNADCGGGVACYQMRGGLEGGAASCANPTGADYYSRMDLVFTKLAPYLSPAAIIPTSTSSQGSMVEFFNPRFDYYFMTSRENEKQLLDDLRNTSGNAEWYRTGYWFKVDPFATPSTSSLTRYYIPGAAKNAARGTHFYTSLNSDKQVITSTGRERSGAGCTPMPDGFFCNEGTDSYVFPTIGSGLNATCGSGLRPIWRVFRGNVRFPDDANHRYVNSGGLYNYMVNDLGWDAESINICVRP
jgi:lysyl endopeptidase